jgi:hypothetical protein
MESGKKKVEKIKLLTKIKYMTEFPFMYFL